MKSYYLVFLMGILVLSPSYAQKPKRYTSSEIQLQLEKLQTLGAVLYVAAHPDDENTGLIGYLSQGAMLETAYLSVTRGDGGQNLVGPEMRERLGIIRTQELLQARAVDGSSQFFTRANDFGYSKTAEETLKIWDKERVLSDMVWTIRKFRPDVMITRFPPDSRAGHGHHTSSAILATEAFEAAGDPNRYPEHLDRVSVWQPKSLYWNTHWWFYGSRDFDKTGLVEVKVGEYNPLLGKSFTEIAAESRSMHKSQGFGSTGSRGESSDYLKYVAGDSITGGLMDGIDITWNRVEGGKEIGDLIAAAYASFNPSDPSTIVPDLMKAYVLMDKIRDEPWVNRKKKDLLDIISSSMGLFMEITTNDYSISPGDSLTLKVEVINRSEIPVKLLSFNEEASTAEGEKELLKFNQPFNIEFGILIPEDYPISQPYWLTSQGSQGMFKVENPDMIGRPENPAAYSYNLALEINGIPVSYNVEAVYKRNDPVDGEVYRPFVVSPPVFINPEENLLVFANEEPKTVNVVVKAGRKETKGTVEVLVPEGWKTEPSIVNFNLSLKYEEQNFSIKVYPPKGQQEGELQFVAKIDNKEYTQSLVTIEYDHIPTQMLYPEATLDIVKIDLEKKGERIGYIMGAGDDIPASLEQIGYKVDLLENGDITLNNLKTYDAVILGVRAYNTVDRMVFDHPILMEYVWGGGNLIVQYNTNFRLKTEEFSPYPIKLGRDRVSDETAAVRILNSKHPLMKSPNKITEKDFRNWVQERGLYFPASWSEEYEAILSSNDPGEEARDGGLLVAQYGKGYYMYTGYSWFRELPAGVPGAYRIFTNMISIGK